MLIMMMPKNNASDDRKKKKVLVGAIPCLGTFRLTRKLTPLVNEISHELFGSKSWPRKTIFICCNGMLRSTAMLWHVHSPRLYCAQVYTLKLAQGRKCCWVYVWIEFNSHLYL